MRKVVVGAVRNPEEVDDDDLPRIDVVHLLRVIIVSHTFLPSVWEWSY